MPPRLERQEKGGREDTLEPRQRLQFSAIDKRPPLKLPDGLRLIVWPVLALEHWDISQPMARMVISPPQGQPMLPDHPNWSWHEYGMRVGFWRLRRVFERLKVTPTVTLNARTCETYPQVVQGAIDSGWELNAHGYEQLPMHKIEDQRAWIENAVEIIARFWGRRPRGWFGPGLTQTYDTLDYLSQAGIEYIGDWVLDDEPVTLKTTHKPVVALPYNFELHDIVMMALQHHPSDMMYRRSMDAFECLYKESAERAKIMAIACHPYLSGQPHRIAYVERAYEEILSRPGVACWDGEKILDWYLATQKGKA
jgi:peptidoglycan/xylan/chitin deacetylase (PgdA/CDA1 family)